MSALDWMGHTVLDDLRDEARRLPQLDDRSAHPTACRCWECKQDAYTPGDDLGSASVAVFLAGCILSALVFLAILALGERTVCAVNGTDGPRYCTAEQATP